MFLQTPQVPSELTQPPEDRQGEPPQSPALLTPVSRAFLEQGLWTPALLGASTRTLGTPATPERAFKSIRAASVNLHPVLLHLDPRRKRPRGHRRAPVSPEQSGLTQQCCQQGWLLSVPTINPLSPNGPHSFPCLLFPVSGDDTFWLQLTVLHVSPRAQSPAPGLPDSADAADAPTHPRGVWRVPCRPICCSDYASLLHWI